MNYLTSGNIVLFGKKVDIVVKDRVEVTMNDLKTVVFESRKTNNFSVDDFMRQLKSISVSLSNNLIVADFFDKQGDSFKVCVLDMNRQRQIGDIISYTNANKG